MINDVRYMQYGDFVMFETISNIDTLQKGIKQNR